MKHSGKSQTKSKIALFISILVLAMTHYSCSQAGKSDISQDSTALANLENRYEGSFSSLFKELALVETKHYPGDFRWIEKPTHLLENLRDYEPLDIEVDSYGGRADIQLDATGFFHVKQLDGRWWIVDPEGHPWYSVGLAAIGMSGTKSGKKALEKVYGTPENWAKQTKLFMKGYYFNSIGPWSDMETLESDTENRMPYTPELGLIKNFGKELGVTRYGYGHVLWENDVMPVFHPEFESYTQKYISDKISHLKDDPYVIGYFSDNEIIFDDNALVNFNMMAESDPQLQTVRKWMTRNSIPVREDAAYTSEEKKKFIEYYADTYFRIVSEAVRTVAPNHMYLGSRNWEIDKYRPVIWKVSGKYVDMNAFNMYFVWNPDYSMLDMWYKASGKPFFLTEWYAKGMDSGLGNALGAGWSVKTQDDRGKYYENITLKLMSHPGCTGWHWFTYRDNDSGSTDPEVLKNDANKGIVSRSYEKHDDILNHMKEINKQVYSLIDFFDSKTIY